MDGLPFPQKGRQNEKEYSCTDPCDLSGALHERDGVCRKLYYGDRACYADCGKRVPGGQCHRSRCASC